MARLLESKLSQNRNIQTVAASESVALPENISTAGPSGDSSDALAEAADCDGPGASLVVKAAHRFYAEELAGGASSADILDGRARVSIGFGVFMHPWATTERRESVTFRISGTNVAYRLYISACW